MGAITSIAGRGGRQEEDFGDGGRWDDDNSEMIGGHAGNDDDEYGRGDKEDGL
jgi:hypothetical protein